MHPHASWGQNLALWDSVWRAKQVRLLCLFVVHLPRCLDGLWTVTIHNCQLKIHEHPISADIHRYPQISTMSHALKLCKASSSSFRRRLMPKTLRLTAGATWSDAGTSWRCGCNILLRISYDIYDWMVRIHIKCMKTWAFIQLQVPKIGFRNALEIPGVLSSNVHPRDPPQVPIPIVPSRWRLWLEVRNVEKSALSLATGFNCQAAKLPSWSISVSQDLQEPRLDCWIMAGEL